MGLSEDSDRAAIRDFAEARVELADGLPVGYFKRLREQGKMLEFVSRFSEYQRVIRDDERDA